MKLTSILIYPIKGMGGISLESSVIERRGLALDRRWMLVDENGVFLSQRKAPKMATIQISIAPNFLLATQSDAGAMPIPFRSHSKARLVQIWRSEVEVVEHSSQISGWFSHILGIKCSLVQMPTSTIRATNPDFSQAGDHVSFADGYPVTIATENSLAELNTHLAESIPMSRFRPNLVVSGQAEPWEEERWKTVQIGDSILRAAKPCGRCVVTTIDQSSGTSSSTEPLTTLAKIRKPGNSVDFSLNVIPENERIVRLGQILRVLEIQD